MDTKLKYIYGLIFFIFIIEKITMLIYSNSELKKTSINSKKFPKHLSRITEWIIYNLIEIELIFCMN